jgi:enterochelin esterase-like enzyme
LAAVRSKALATCVVVLSLGASAAGAGVARDQVTASFRSVALQGTMHALVYLPPGYTAGRERYPVVYFLHGLPAGPYGYTRNKWVADALAASGRPAILVEPQGARDGDGDPEYLNWGSGRDWETYISRELVAYVDRHFRTIPTRQGRALVGVSAGGYGAVIDAVHDLAGFGAIESWSGYFHATDPTGTVPLDRGPDADAHVQIAVLAADMRQRSTFLAFYVGRADSRFRDENVQFANELTAARVPHLFEVYAGSHQQSLWQAHAESWLALALAHLSPPTDATVP